MISGIPLGVEIPSYAKVTNLPGTLSPNKPVFFGYNTYIFDTHFAHMLPGIQSGMKDDQVENLSIAAACV